jgi:hypothetical protein
MLCRQPVIKWLPYRSRILSQEIRSRPQCFESLLRKGKAMRSLLARVSSCCAVLCFWIELGGGEMEAKMSHNEAPAPNRRPRFPLVALFPFVYLFCAPPASPAPVGEARRWAYGT